jgi:hypothetical protein
VGPVLANQTAKLFITYESDYSTAAHTEVKTVRFPLNATSTGDDGTRSTALSAGTAQAFEYFANIPDAVADGNILDVHFELHAQVSAASSNGSMTAGIIGGSTSPAYKTISVLGDTSDQFVIYRPPIDSTNFQRNTSQRINITPTTNALNVVGGELVITYKYQTDAAIQTETVRYIVGQSATSNSTASSSYVISPVISNTGVAVQYAYIRAGAGNNAATNLHIRTDMDDVGASPATTTTYATVFTGTEQVGTNRIIHNITATSSFVSGGPINIQSRYSATGGNPVALELFLTFTWSGSSGGTITKSVEFSVPNSGHGNTAATTAQVQYDSLVRLKFPERYTKTLRSAHMQSEIISSDTTSPVNVNAGFNQDTITSGGTGFLGHTSTAEGMSFYFLEGATTTFSVASTTEINTYNLIVDAAVVQTSKALVTYDVAFTGVDPSTLDRQIKTIEYAFGNSNATITPRTTAIYATDVGIGTTTAWSTTTAPTLASQGFTFPIHGTGIDIVDAWVEYRAITSSSTAEGLTDLDMALSVCATSCGSAPTYQQLPLFGLPTTLFHTIQTGEHQVIYARANATAALQGFNDGQWANGIETILRSTATTPDVSNITAKLFITYESDFSQTAHTEVKTVRFPLNATSTGDSGSRTTALSAATAQAFQYYANIPDAVADSNILDVHFELHTQVSAAATDGTVTAGIIGGSTSPAYKTVSRLGDTSDQFVIYRPPINGTNFQRNTTQYLNVTPTTNALNVVGGELVITYKYQTNAPSQTETVTYMVGQSATSNSTASSTYVINPVISNTGAVVQNIYVRAGAPNNAATTLHLRGDIDDTGSASALTNSYSTVFTGTEQIGTSRVIFDMSDYASSFVSGGPVNIQSRYEATGGDPVSLELFITFTWNGNLGGPMTKRT